MIKFSVIASGARQSSAEFTARVGTNPGLPRFARNDESGFTLVELSIVLVIIGLLIGGILAAQSMISTSKINAVAMQIGQFDTGVENFKTKYNCLPGDCKAFGGNGDGVITGIYAPGTSAYSGEMANFWNQLFPDQYAAVGYGGGSYQAIYSNASKNVPLSKLGSTNSFFVAAALSTDGNNADRTNPQNCYLILDGLQLQTQFNSYYWFKYTGLDNAPSLSAVKPSDLLALDKKIDDGLANSGYVKAGSIMYGGSSPPNAIGAPSASAIYGQCSSVGNYLVNNNVYECTPVIRIGASVGDPQ